MDLALKYRPKTFEDVVGQHFVTEILKKQIETHTNKNSYLFCGAHGCGKTTCARIFANEINHNQGQPIEIDGASNNGVDNIRALISDAQMSAVDADYKCYIIDEAHMITTAGWNAALKLVEEPPLHCIFIFCTTNPEKIPSTILSRVQRFDFKKIPVTQIAGRLAFILLKENISTFEKEALNRIAVLSDGHMRDAIKILDSCLDVDKNITVELVESLFGLVKQESVDQIINALLNKNLKGCMEEYEHCKSMSFDGVKLYEAVLGSVFDLELSFYVPNMFTYSSLSALKTKESAMLVKHLASLMYENKINLTRDNADTIIKYIFIKWCANE